jgi:hypothetical protein
VREIRTLRAMWRALETGATAIPKRARRGKPRIQAKEEPTGHRASARPYPLIDKFVDHVLVQPKLKRHRPLIRFPSGIALYVHVDVSRIGRHSNSCYSVYDLRHAVCSCHGRSA